MRGAGWLRGALPLVLLASACARDNPAYRGVQEDAGVLPDGGDDRDGRAGDGGDQRDGSQSGDAAPGTCTSGAKTCLGNVLLKCDAGSWVPLKDGPSLCVVGDLGGYCGGFYPSNELPKCGGYDSALLAFVADTGAPVVIDTDTYTITQNAVELAWVAHAEFDQGADAPALALFKFDSFQVPAGATVVAVGKRALAVWAQGDVVVAGALRAGGAVITALPVIRQPAGAWTPAATWTAGAGGVGTEGAGLGGGGYGAKGGAGGHGPPPTSAPGGSGGLVYGTEDLIPLRGGSPGGGASTNRSITAGGGAIQIVACRSFALRQGGVVSASGQGGTGGTVMLSGGEFLLTGGDGGGSGGAILIESPLIHLAAVIAANGGGGGGGAALGPGTSHGERGEDGHEDDVAAAGGEPASPYAGKGGVGGVLSVPAGGNAGSATATGSSAGGGGGGVGRIRLNVTTLDRADLGIVDAAGALVSPAPTKGEKPIW
ncbi:MAG: hypothetical protein HY906_02335 [Deltaproteobacteria bacterium]|nr:hypothetical protein [Deltaproteobacteria bacterium]